MFTTNSKATRRGRGRPPGGTGEGEATRRRLYDTAIGLIDERGYDATTLRDVAARAGVSVGLLYRYFPSKRALVLELYDRLSDDYAREADLPSGRWRDRTMAALATSLRVLRPHRITLRALAPLMVGDAEEGVFARSTAFSRRRVQSVFEAAVVNATDAPARPLAESLGRLFYLLHLGVILWWLLDKTPAQRATSALVSLLAEIQPAAALALRLRPIRRFVQKADDLFREGLLDQPDAVSESR
jgi:AcrR family transcriptional regulator